MHRSNRTSASLGALAASIVLATPIGLHSNLSLTVEASISEHDASKERNMAQTLSNKQKAIAPIAAYTAVGDMPKPDAALNQGLDAGLSINDCKEILVQLYAYAGFPRSLNALGELMKVLDARKQRGIQDTLGESAAVPTTAESLSIGTANQTKLAGAPVKGPLFEFAPEIDQFLKAHLFGDIFARANLDWQSRELATVGALAAMTGVEAQLQAHVHISMNVGLTAAQLAEFAQVLNDQGEVAAGKRIQTILDRQ